MQLPGFLTAGIVDTQHLERYLLPQERHTVTIRKHPAMLLSYVGETLGGLILAGALSAAFSHRTALTVIWVAWLLIAGRLAYKVYEWSDDYLAVTQVRVMRIHGIVTRRVDMMPLNKITDLVVNRSIVGRLLGYGTIVLESAGQDQALSKLKYIPEPEALYLNISAAAFGSRDG